MEFSIKDIIDKYKVHTKFDRYDLHGRYIIREENFEKLEAEIIEFVEAATGVHLINDNVE